MLRSVRSQARLIRAMPETKYSLWMLLGQLGVSLSAFLVTYVLANYVSKEVVGQYRFILAAYTTISVLGLFGIGAALMQSIAKGKLASLNQAFVYKFKYSFICVGVFLSVAIYYYLQEEYQLAVALVITGLLLPVTEAYGLYGYYLQGNSRFKLAATFLAFDKIMVAVVLAATALIYPSLVPLVIAYAVVRALSSFIFYKLSVRRVPPVGRSDEGMFAYASHMTFMSLLGAIIGQVDKYVLFFFFGAVPLALYWIASVVPLEVSRIMGVAVNTFFPRYVRAEGESAIFMVRKLFWSATVVLAVVGLVYSFCAPWIFSTFVSQYTSTDGISRALFFGLGFVPHIIVWQIFSAQKKIKSLYYISVGEPILAVILYLILIPLWGLWGLVLAILIKTMLLNLCAVWYLYWGYKYSYPSGTGENVTMQTI